MKPLRHKVEGIIAGRNANPLLTPILGVLSVFYGGALGLRTRGYRYGLFQSRRLPCRVVSVGNITAGGTGKTPMTIWLARALQQAGLRVAVVSRGYGGGAQKTGGIVSDGGHIRMGPAAAGDEPFMMARTLPEVPVLVGGDRYRSGMTALRRFQPDVILLDDGFQHLKLKRDLDLVLLDRRHPLGNGRVLPRGPLREPVQGLDRADVFVLTRCDGIVPTRENAYPFLPPGKPVFRSVHRPYLHSIIAAGKTGDAEKSEFPQRYSGDIDPKTVLEGVRVFAFSGIADNPAFLDTIGECGGIPVGHVSFADHYLYSAEDLDRIARSAQESGAEWLVTTEKDFVRLSRERRWPLDLAVIGVAICFGEAEKAFLEFIHGYLKKNQGKRS